MDGPGKPDVKPARAGFWYTMKAVVWSFVGLRRDSDFNDTDAKLNPFYIVAAALIGVALFIGLLLVAVRFAVSP
jgi:hypothetical protein